VPAPAVWIFANPQRGKRTKGSRILSRRALAAEYVHTENGQNYRHDFQRGVTIEALPDGSVRMFRADGKPIIRDF
jgi:hypothetical protein